MKKTKYFAIILIIALGGLLCCWGGCSWVKVFLECNYAGYVPAESNDQFMELVLDAYMSDDAGFLSQVATKDAIRSLGYIPKDSLSPIVQVYPTDSLDSIFNYRVEMVNEQYFDVYLEYEKWPECPDKDFTDDEVTAHYRLTSVGKLIQP